MSNIPSFGKELRRLRKNTKTPKGGSLTQIDMADLIGVSNGLISFWETDHTKPSINDRKTLLGIVSALFRFNGIKSYLEANELLLLGGYADLSDQEINDLGFSLDFPKNIKDKHIDWGDSPGIEISLFGREEVLDSLSEMIVDNSCRMVSIFGIGGLGKTLIAKHLSVKIEDRFDYILWKSLLNAPYMDSLLKECIQFLSNQEEININESNDNIINHFLKYLRDNRCLLILDNFESVLRHEPVGQYREGYEGYGQLITKIGQCDHNSCVILTSREVPRGFGLLTQESLRVKSYNLTGIDVYAAQEMLKGNGLSGYIFDWQKLVDRYSGNPLALRIVSCTITEIYNGNIPKFLNEATHLVQDRIYDVLNEQFERLSALEQDIMIWLAIERDVVNKEQISASLVNITSHQEIAVAIQALIHRSMIEYAINGFKMQNVIIEYISDRIIEWVYDEIINKLPFRLRTHGLIKAQSYHHIRDTQFRVILKPISNKLLRYFNNYEDMITTMIDIIQKYKGKPITQQGYIAGNIINLLTYMMVNLKGMNFSELVIRQAYLQNIDLHNVDFTSTRFIDCVFTETFDNPLSASFNLNGQSLVTGSMNGEIRLWSIPEGKLIKSYIGHSDWVWGVSFSPDGRLIASVSADEKVRIWDTLSGDCIHILTGHINRVFSIDFSPDGLFVATGGEDHTIHIWNPHNGKCIAVLQGHERQVWAVTFSPDGKLLASTGEDNSIIIWDMETFQPKITLLGHREWVRTLAFHPNNQYLASGSIDKTIRFWNIKNGNCENILYEKVGRVFTLAFSLDGELLASSGEEPIIRIWSTKTLQCKQTLVGHNTRVNTVHFNKAGFLISGSDDQTLRLWDVNLGKCINELKGYTNPVWSVVVDQTSKIVGGYEDGIIRIWDSQSHQYLRSLSGHTKRLWAVSISPDGNKIASCGDDNTIRLWDAKTGQQLKVWQNYNHWGRSVSFSPDGRFFSNGGADHSVIVWDTETGDIVHKLYGHKDWVRSVSFHPNYPWLFSGGEDNTIICWDITTGKSIQHFVGHTNRLWSIACSHKSDLLASGSRDKTIRLWDIHTGKCKKILTGHNHWVKAVAFNPSDTLLVSGSEDLTIRIWDLSNDTHKVISPEHTNRITSITFSSDGENILTSSQDDTIRVWDLITTQCIKVIRSARPYEGLVITDTIGLTDIQITTLKQLGAKDSKQIT